MLIYFLSNLILLLIFEVNLNRYSSLCSVSTSTLKFFITKHVCMNALILTTEVLVCNKDKLIILEAV